MKLTNRLTSTATATDLETRTLVVVARDITPAEEYEELREQFSRLVKDGGATVVCTSMIDEDIRAFYGQPWVMVGSDGGLANRHPRGAGTFPRVLGRYVREQRWLTLPSAAHRRRREVGCHARNGRRRSGFPCDPQQHGIAL